MSKIILDKDKEETFNAIRNLIGGKKGPLGCDKDGYIDALSMSIAYTRQIEKQYIEISKRLQQLVDEQHTNSRNSDSKIFVLIARLGEDIKYLKVELDALEIFLENADLQQPIKRRSIDVEVAKRGRKDE